MSKKWTSDSIRQYQQEIGTVEYIYDGIPSSHPDLRTNYLWERLSIPKETRKRIIDYRKQFGNLPTLKLLETMALEQFSP
jgi:hypothetical protein